MGVRKVGIANRLIYPLIRPSSSRGVSLDFLFPLCCVLFLGGAAQLTNPQPPTHIHTYFYDSLLYILSSSHRSARLRIQSIIIPSRTLHAMPVHDMDASCSSPSTILPLLTGCYDDINSLSHEETIPLSMDHHRRVDDAHATRWDVCLGVVIDTRIGHLLLSSPNAHFFAELIVDFFLLFVFD